MNRKIVEIKRYAEKICWLNKENYEFDKQRRSWISSKNSLCW